MDLDYTFVYGIYQLVIGRQWTNKQLFDNNTRADIKASFAAFKQQFPNIHCPLVESTTPGKPRIGFLKILSSTAQLYATCMKNHIVEGFEQYYISYLQARLCRLVPVSILLILGKGCILTFFFFFFFFG
jgi:hypothetical protein